MTIIRTGVHLYKYIVFVIFLLGFTFLISNQTKLKAATCTWSGAIDDLWSTSGNWDCGVPTSDDTLVFPVGASNLATVNDIVPSAYTHFSDIFIQTSSYTFSGQDIDVFGVLEFEGLNQTLTFGLNVNSENGYLALKVDDIASIMIMAGNITSGTDLYKQLGGKVMLDGAQSGAFPFFIQEGELVARGANSLNGFTNIEVSPGATLSFDGNVTSSSPISLSGLINVIDGASTLNGSIAMSSGGGFGGPGGQLTLTGVVSGNTSLNKDGAHTLTLSGSASNTYTGNTNINTGDLILLNSVGTAIPSSIINVGDSTGTVDSARILVQASDQFNASAAITVESDGFLAYEGVGTSNNITDLNLNGGHAKITGTSVLSGTIVLGSGHLEGYDTASISSAAISCTNTSGPSVIDGDGWTFSNTDISINAGDTLGSVQCSIDSAIHGGANITTVGKVIRFNGNNNFTGTVTISSGSVLEVGNANSLGNSSAETTVSAGGALSLYNNITVAAEPLFLNGVGIDTVGTLGSSSGTNVYTGAITLQGTANITIAVTTNSTLTLSGAIDGTTTQGLILQRFSGGSGVIQLGAANTFSATIITIQDADVRKTASVNVFPDTIGLFISSGSNFDLNSFAETIGSLAGDSGGTVTLGNATMSIGANSTNTTYGGLISGNGGITKTGTGTLTFTGNNNYTGTTNISNGKLLVNGLQSSSNVNLSSTGVLGGSGRVGVITGGGSGGISPGNSPGILSVTGNVAFANTNSFNVELNGTTVGSGYDQLNVTGSVNLNSATLNITLGYTPNSSDTYTILQASGALIGTFNGLPNGSTFTVSGNTFRIDYGTNSVVISATTSNPNSGGDTLSETGISIPLVALVFLASTTAVVVFTNRYTQKRKRLSKKNFR